MTDTYEGWSNRETWAANLWLANDEGLYYQTLALAEACLTENDDEPVAIHVVAEELQDWFAGWSADVIDGEPTTEAMRNMLADIDSLYRIDWHEIAEDWIADAKAEAEG